MIGLKVRVLVVCSFRRTESSMLLHRLGTRTWSTIFAVSGSVRSGAAASTALKRPWPTCARHRLKSWMAGLSRQSGCTRRQAMKPGRRNSGCGRCTWLSVWATSPLLPSPMPSSEGGWGSGLHPVRSYPAWLPSRLGRGGSASRTRLPERRRAGAGAESEKRRSKIAGPPLPECGRAVLLQR